MDGDRLFERRQRVLGPSYFHFFDRPLHLVKGEGLWVWDAEGRRYLDCYNNVPSVGHCHPHVVVELHKQASLLNTNTRYLHEHIVRLAERLTATMPEELDTCLFVCTGSEANDLAVQMARRFTGREGCLATDGAYHGNTTLVRILSPESYPPEERPDWLGVIDPPDTYRGAFSGLDAGQRFAEQAGEVIDAMTARGFPPAAMILDTIWDAPGPLWAPEDYPKLVQDKLRAAGGLLIADEVQSGYCRLGEHWWGFQHYGLTPDIVTMGKPMGDGHPLAAVITRREIAEAFAERSGYFNTFGGNPVSGAAGNAVIDVIERENLLPQIHDSATYLTGLLADLQAKQPLIGCLRGRGLFQGVDLVRDPAKKDYFSRKDLKHLTTLIAEEGVLVGTSGMHGQALKLRPPLPFTREHAEIAAAAIGRALERFADEL